ncbi:type III toxin-antitoxin system ToxN/AbiQ family toxin [Vibrio scophthalmi]|uniref:type III toxin-antitoxin system ToxN/AbiQ family toxin n=1 Tax=Vibrio scophthalmi TaxID=45658 RepID=UPI003AB00B4C
MKIYTISDSYLDHLRNVDSKVPSNDYKNDKPYIGVLLEVNNCKYLAPLTSQKPSIDAIPANRPTIFKLHADDDETDKLGAIQILYMIPVVESEITELDIDSITDEFYKGLLNKQVQFIRKNSEAIQKKAKKLYNLVINNRGNFANNSCDFLALEKAKSEYTKPEKKAVSENKLAELVKKFK